MKPAGNDNKSYFARLEKRGKKSRVHRSYQLVGLNIAEMLDDAKHKSLYIKLAKEKNSEKLLQLAKSVAERKNIKNKGAYFMKVLKIEEDAKK